MPTYKRGFLRFTCIFATALQHTAVFVWVKFLPHPSNVLTNHQGICFLATLATDLLY